MPFFSHSSQCQSSSEEVCVDGYDDDNDDDGDGDGDDSNNDVIIIRVMKMVLMTLMVNITWS